jgi:phage tail sheath protein FI
MSYFKTPGVYIKEQDAFGSSVVAVPTAVPAFIGYTQSAEQDGNSLSMKPVKVRSLAEFREIFGGGPRTTFKVGPDGSLSVDEKTRFLLFSSLRMFYANGGGECYVVSTGSYSDEIDPEKFGEALQLLTKEQEPTIILIPDAVLLPKDDCYSIYKDVLQHCGAKMRSRIAIVDVWGGSDAKTKDVAIRDFREGIGSNYLAFGSVYYPWLHTTITPASEIDYRNVSNRKDFAKFLIDDIKKAMGITAAPDAKAAPAKDAADKGAADKGAKKEDAKDGGEDRRLAQITAAVNQILDDNADPKLVVSTVGALSAMYKTVINNIRTELNLLPPSAAMAGVYALVDKQEGVHKAPANVSLNAVVKPSVSITSDDQEDMNSPLSGKAINAIRSFVGKGVLVWGARSMDANSQDWRYISVRRALIMIEQSIKNSVEAYVFEPNTARTWLKLKTSIENFLTDVWKAGTLAGATPSQAFEVHVGLGSTMTPNDILEGIMRVSIKVAITRPAEFIEITFEQKMQES